MVKIDLPGSPEFADMAREALRVHVLVDEPVYFEFNGAHLRVTASETVDSLWRRYLEKGSGPGHS